MTGMLALDAGTLNPTSTRGPGEDALAQGDRGHVSPSGSSRARPSTSAARVNREPSAAPTLRIRPVPRSEPLTDEERGAGLSGAPVIRADGAVGRNVTARTLPPDPATGVRVRRRAREGVAPSADHPAVPAGGGAPVRRAAAGVGMAGGHVGPTPPPRPAEPGSRPAVLRAPEAITTVVATRLHSPLRTGARGGGPAGTAVDGGPPPAAAVAPPPEAAEVVTVVAPGLGRAPTGVPTPSAGLDLRVSARRLLATCLEILGGFRPIAQLRPYCAPERFDSIANRLLRPVGVGRGHGATHSSLIASRLAPPRAGRPARTAPDDRITVRRVQICDVMEGIAELVVVMARRNKVWAMTLRMERNRGRWMCMHLEVL